ncbi:hypothetical protein EOW65_03830 [Sinirhodobacter ferrireducens]|uniref:Uncharacterized protein n=1 Tax=Paenirhodobacter ferrireducens TaxID=1215032 RepID=A0A443LQ69_9RHOB|nr:hypothetical protein [Sinirhodobacter ferrireducens]RWR51306.1 hypothetical protein EOW65_03830 [Sinirhodobacter ferrireducens]
MAEKKWRPSKDPLFRGDHKDSLCVPVPSADDSIVRHVMYLEGPGRETPYLSTTEQREVAERFAQQGGVWSTSVSNASAEGVTHISKSDLLGLMRGQGKGDAKWPDAYEVMQARRYVEEHGEHLLDFRKVDDPKTVVTKIFFKP